MKIICVGQNYLNHIKELNSKRNKSPILFLKPDSSIIQKNQPFFTPNWDFIQKNQFLALLELLGSQQALEITELN